MRVNQLLLLLCPVLLLGACTTPRASNSTFEELLIRNDRIATAQLTESEHLLQELEEQGVLLELPGARARVESVLIRLFSTEERNNLRVHFARLPGENAFALPSGDIVVHLAMLAALESEEQLAFVLAHEASHIMENHAWLGALNRKSKRAAAHVTDILTLGSGLSYRHFAKSVQRYGRQQEFAADRQAADRLNRAGYNVAAATTFFDVLEKYPLALSGSEAFFTHPDNRERKSRLSGVAETAGFAPASGKDSRMDVAPADKSYFTFRQPLLERSIADKIEEQDFPGALTQVVALEQNEVSVAVTECLRGQIYAALSRDQTQSTLALREASLAADDDGNSVQGTKAITSELNGSDFFARQARLSFLAANRAEPGVPCVQRGLALLSYQRGNYSLAERLLRQYLRNNPHDPQYHYLQLVFDNLQAGFVDGPVDSASDTHSGHSPI